MWNEKHLNFTIFFFKNAYKAKLRHRDGFVKDEK